MISSMNLEQISQEKILKNLELLKKNFSHFKLFRETKNSKKS